MGIDSRGTLVKEIAMGDVEDPYLYAAFPLSEWEKTEEAEYIKQHVPEGELVFYCDPDPSTYGYKIRVFAPLTGPALTYYNLKYLGIKG